MTETTRTRRPRVPRTPRMGREVEDSRMTLVEHLTEFRERLVKSVLALGAGTVTAFFLFPRIFDLVSQPYCDLDQKYRPFIPGECKLVFLGVIDGFAVRMQVSLIVGALLASPVWLYQLAAFVTPGLHRRERRWAYPFVGISFLLFALGAVFAYLTMDNGLVFLLGIGGDDLAALLGAKQYLSFFSLMLVAFGVSFEFPLLLVFLELVGVVDDVKLRSWRRSMYFGLSVFTAIITPSQDPFTFLAMWLPLILSYEAVVVYARLHARAKARRGDGGTGTGRWGDDETSPIDA